MIEPQFFLPEKYLPSPDQIEGWRGRRSHVLNESGKIAAAQCWIFQTWLRLHDGAFPCRLVHQMPQEGLMVTLSGCVPLNLIPPPEIFFVDIVADGYVHPAAHAHVLQNPLQQRVIPESFFIPLWPQHDIIPRDPSRGDTFENVFFFGDQNNLAVELRDAAWTERLALELGLRFEIRGSTRWNDYREADAVIAARAFDGGIHLHKPPTKLFNAWLAGAAFVCAPESAYLAERRDSDDFLIAHDAHGVFEALRRLKNDRELFRRMRHNAAVRARECSVEAMRERWEKLFAQQLPPKIEAWKSMSPIRQRCISTRQRITLALRQRMASSRLVEYLLRRAMLR